MQLVGDLVSAFSSVLLSAVFSLIPVFLYCWLSSSESFPLLADVFLCSWSCHLKTFQRCLVCLGEQWSDIQWLGRKWCGFWISNWYKYSFINYRNIWNILGIFHTILASLQGPRYKIITEEDLISTVLYSTIWCVWESWKWQDFFLTSVGIVF